MGLPTEDYPGPSKSHPEKEDTNDPPRTGHVDPEEPAMPLPPPVEKDEEKQ